MRAPLTHSQELWLILYLKPIVLLTKGNLEYQWQLWGTFETPRLSLLKIDLNHHSSKIPELNKMTISIGNFRLPNVIRSLTLLFWNNVLSWTEANKQRRNRFWIFRLFFLGIFSQALPLVPSSFFPSMSPISPLYPQLPHTNSVTEPSFFSKTLSTPFVLNFWEIVHLNLSLLRIYRVKPLFFIFLGESRIASIVKDFPKVIKDHPRLAEKFNIIIQMINFIFLAYISWLIGLSMKTRPSFGWKRLVWKILRGF